MPHLNQIVGHTPVYSARELEEQGFRGERDVYKRQLLGEVVTTSTKKNLEMRVEAENGATAGKFDPVSYTHLDVYKRQA